VRRFGKNGCIIRKIKCGLIALKSPPKKTKGHPEKERSSGRARIGQAVVLNIIKAIIKSNFVKI
jgi:hypothetical protein